MLQVAVSRPLPFEFRVPGAAVRFGPERGQSASDLHRFVAGAHGIVTWVSERVDGAFLDAAGKQLKVVANFAVGYDNIEVAECRRRGVIVTNTPDAVTEGTADMAWAMLLGAARRMGAGDRFARSGAWAAHGILGRVSSSGSRWRGGRCSSWGRGGSATRRRCGRSAGG